MARSYKVVEINKFNAGLITDASPLTSPDNSSLQEENFILNIDGSRNRRFGMNLESGFETITTSINSSGIEDVAYSTYTWDNAGGDPSKSILVVQFGKEIKFFDLDTTPISGNLIFTHSFSAASDSQLFDYAVVDGILVVVTGTENITYFEYDADTITASSAKLLIRDFFGVEDILDGKDLTRGNGVQTRPTSLESNHLYNLRNQSWSIPRLNGGQELIIDPIEAFFGQASGYPSNSDNVIVALYPDASDTDDRLTDRFFAKDLATNPPGTTRAAMGYFIIEALSRGASRIQSDLENRDRFPQLTYSISSLPEDRTPGGATAVSEFAGRVWYAGFSGEVIDGDSLSPRMSSYILFSKTVDTLTDIITCYQEGDPTSKDAPDIIDTDGGFIRINEAYGIKSLINLVDSLIVVAVNGVWRIVGGTEKGFTATNYIVEKITDRGCTNSDSIAIIDNTFMYWGSDGIYHVHTNQFGGWVSENISLGRIQTLFDTIPIESKNKAKGSYDSYEKKVRWLYYNDLNGDTETKELVLDINLKAYYLNSIKQIEGSSIPRTSMYYRGNPYQLVLNEVRVVVDGDEVVVGLEDVVIVSETRSGSSNRELGYVAITSLSPTIEYTFAAFTNTNFIDWESYDGVGVDAEAFMVTSYMSGTDFMRDKQVPYLVAHLRRTENGFEEVDDDIVPLNQSSCLIQVRWDWANSANSGKWGREFQAYRYRRMYSPADVDSEFDNGFPTIVTRNKVRGNGKVLSIRFRTEPYKNLHLYGWSMIFSVAENV